MTSVLGGRGTVITGLSVGEGGRGGREGKEEGEGGRGGRKGREEGWKGEKGKGMEKVRREGRGERRVIKEIQVYVHVHVCTNRKCTCKICKTVSQVVASMN